VFENIKSHDEVEITAELGARRLQIGVQQRDVGISRSVLCFLRHFRAKHVGSIVPGPAEKGPIAKSDFKHAQSLHGDALRFTLEVPSVLRPICQEGAG